MQARKGVLREEAVTGMRGLILINAYCRLESFLYQSSRLKEEFGKLGVECDIRQNDFFAADIKDGRLRLNVSGYDFAIYLDKDMYMSKMLEDAGLKVFNSHESIRICDDKMLTHIVLAGAGIRMPDALSGLLCYTQDAKVSRDTLKHIGDTLGYPVIVKESYGSLGKGVFRADNEEELKVLAERLRMRPHLFERYIASSCGRDMRIIVIGGRVVASMIRSSDKDFRSNIELGGVGHAMKPDDMYADIAIKAAQAIGLVYAGVDVLFGEDGPIVCEVNSNAFFGGIEKVTGVNVAREYALEVMRIMNKG